MEDDFSSPYIIEFPKKLKDFVTQYNYSGSQISVGQNTQLQTALNAPISLETGNPGHAQTLHPISNAKIG
jgi:hypothetical protein